MSTEQFDLSKLKINRENDSNGKSARSPRTSYLLYGSGALFLILAHFSSSKIHSATKSCRYYNGLDDLSVAGKRIC